MATEIGKFQQKIGHYSACIRDITKIRAPTLIQLTTTFCVVNLRYVSFFIKLLLYCIVLYCIVLYCIVLYCIVPNRGFSGSADLTV